MDGQRFDALTRACATESSRRQVAKGFLGGILTALATHLHLPVTVARERIATFTTAKPERSSGGSTPEKVAAEVVAALSAQDLAALGALYLPDTAPATWSDVWPSSTGFEPDFTGCVGAAYQTVSWSWSYTRACYATELSTDVEVLVSFDVPACGRGTTDDSSFTISTLTMRLLRRKDGWYLVGIVEFNGEVPEFWTPSCIDTSTGLLPSYYVGTWPGRGWQNNPDNTWPIVMSLTANPIGSVVGTSSYPSLGCEGQLVLTSIYRVDYSPNVTFEETITVGRDNCIDGTFTLTTAESGQMIPFSWTNADGSTVAHGSFVRNTIGLATKNSLEVHASLCPAGYDGSDIFETCHDVGQADVWFQVYDGIGAWYGGLTRLDASPGPGIIVFENLMSGPSFVNRLGRYIEGREYIYCSTDDGETILAQFSGPSGEPLALDIPEGKHVVCDWYTIPDRCTSFGRPCNGASDCCPSENCSARGTCGTCQTDADCAGDFHVCCADLNPVCGLGCQDVVGP